MQNMITAAMAALKDGAALTVEPSAWGSYVWDPYGAPGGEVAP